MLCKERAILFTIFVQSGLILSVDYIPTSTRYHIAFNVLLGLYWINNTLYFYLEMLLWFMVDGSVVDLSILGISQLKSLNEF